MSSLFVDPTQGGLLFAQSEELTAALAGVHVMWARRDGASFVAAARVDGRVTIVGNSGGWWLVRTADKGRPDAKPVSSARAAAEMAGQPAP